MVTSLSHHSKRSGRGCISVKLLNWHKIWRIFLEEFEKKNRDESGL